MVLLNPDLRPGYNPWSSEFSLLAGFGVDQEWKGGSLKGLNDFIHKTQGEWRFPFFSYSLKDSIENLNTQHSDELGFPVAGMILPKLVFRIHQGYLEVLRGDLDPERFLKSKPNPFPERVPEIKAEMSREEYLLAVEKIKVHLQMGDAYEVTYCQNFRAEAEQFPMASYLNSLFKKYPSPMAGFFKYEDSILASNSPERFLKKKGNTLFSQPMKGTARRGGSMEEDEKIAMQLMSSEKERAENIMITDLVRNDLGRIAVPGGVKVEELCGHHLFPTVHQLITTVSCEMKEGLEMEEILQATFPMGSMTGAPKISSMEIIDRLETFHRGMFSGSIGYMNPEGDFDLNVTIRSAFYNQKKSFLNLPVGGAITIASQAEEEYMECLVKLKAQEEVIRSIFV